MTSWTETRLWKQLASSSSSERPSIEGLLQQWMPDIERVLNAGTAPLDFTLHDAEHSFRVAEWMARIVPEDVLAQLSIYELALLLLSAYLHDIGMTPEHARVQRHWRHLVFGPVPTEERGLSQVEAADFRRWLDDERGALVTPLAQDGRPGEDELRKAAELITYYARYKHNDWSREWIWQNAKGALGSYESWVEDLVRLCQSHHKGYTDLLKESFDPRPAGRHGEVVHLRYLASVLRVADILDVDPERTPFVLFQHRDIAPKSFIYWWKDHDFWVRPDSSTLIIHARPCSAVVEKAVRDMADCIRVELETCARLNREKPFSYSSFQTSEPLPHRWEFPDSIQLHVRPRNDDYVYIDGAFRPNTAKLLELLSGIQLYKEPLAAVRELLQNAFDAVKEQIALERLEGDSTDSKWVESITALQSVELRFEEKDSRFWLVCTDSGVGMTRAIIEKYLLVSGSARRHDILELERRCEAAGFHLGCTGQFGIGVLSYFMLADCVELRTRRSSDRGDAETHGWWFQTEGVGSFGELRKDSQGKRGTTVRLRLRQHLVAGRDGFLSRLQNYLLDVLLRVPCSFRLVVDEETVARLRFDAGWQPSENRLVDNFIRQIAESIQSSRTNSDIEKSLVLREWAFIAERFRAAIQWKTEVGHLPSGIGQYRLSLPSFKLPGGRSEVFFDFDRDRGVAMPLPFVGRRPPRRRRRAINPFEDPYEAPCFALALRPEVRTSIQGMKINNARDDRVLSSRELLFFNRCFVNIDWKTPEAGQIAVDRNILWLTTEADEAISWLENRIEEFRMMVLSEEPSDYNEVASIFNDLVSPPSEAWWFVNPSDQKGLRWERLSFPALSGSSLNILNKAVQARGDGRILSVGQSFWVERGGIDSSRTLGMAESRICPIRPAVVSTSPLVIIPLYVASSEKNFWDSIFFGEEFPPIWSSLAAIANNDYALGGTWLWNRDHPLVRAVKASDLEWRVASREKATHMREYLQTRGRSALYLMAALENLDLEKPNLEEESERWSVDFWADLWESVALEPAEIVSWVQLADGNGKLWIISPKSLEQIPATDPLIHHHLPDPGDKWKLTITYKDGSE